MTQICGSESVNLPYLDREFDWFESLCQRKGCELLILNNESLSPEQEMVQDLMTIVYCFSSRLYGLRNYKKKLKEALASDGLSQDNLNAE